MDLLKEANAYSDFVKKAEEIFVSLPASKKGVNNMSHLVSLMVVLAERYIVGRKKGGLRKSAVMDFVKSKYAETANIPMISDMIETSLSLFKSSLKNVKLGFWGQLLRFFRCLV